MDVHAVIFRYFVSLCCAAKVDCSLDWHLTIFSIHSCCVKISSAFTLLNMLESREITKLVVGSVLSQEVSCFLVYLKCWGAWNTMFHFCSMTLVHKIFFRLIVSHVRTTSWKRKKKHFFFSFLFSPPLPFDKYGIVFFWDCWTVFVIAGITLGWILSGLWLSHNTDGSNVHRASCGNSCSPGMMNVGLVASLPCYLTK